MRKSAAAAVLGRERVRRESMRGRTQVQPQTLEAAEYVLVFTTLEPRVEAAQVMALYRLRWQIELEFKRLKSLLHLGHLNTENVLRILDIILRPLNRLPSFVQPRVNQSMKKNFTT